MKFGLVVSEVCERTDRQTDIVITILRTPLVGEIMMPGSLLRLLKRHIGLVRTWQVTADVVVYSGS